MNVRMKGDKLIHLPTRKKRFPFEITDKPYPYCGLVRMGAKFEWTEHECNCSRCQHKKKIEDKMAQGQLQMEL